jgi:glycosyltransferase involved in cell wall biosynthesis
MPFLANALDRLPVLAYANGPTLFRRLSFSPGWGRTDSSGFLNGLDADVVNLHWVNYGFLSPEGIGNLRHPLVWTLHDMWPFTGGCHYAGTCAHYRNGCGMCPVLGSRRADDISHRLWQRKSQAWRNKDLSIVTPSAWLAKCAQSEGALFENRPVRTIANPIKVDRFSPGDRAVARRRFGLPQDAPLILFGGHRAIENPVKGFPLLRAALRKLESVPPKARPHLVVFGSDERARQAVAIDVQTHFLGYLSGDADLIAAYRAADIFVLPSQQDNLPNTVAEALACGTPCVAVAVGGVPDMIRHGRNGFLVTPGDAEGMAQAIENCLAAARAGPAFREAAREAALAQFDSRKIGKAYMDVFRETMQRTGRPV